MYSKNLKRKVENVEMNLFISISIHPHLLADIRVIIYQFLKKGKMFEIKLRVNFDIIQIFVRLSIYE